MLTRDEVIYAIKHSRSNRDAADFLGMDIRIWKKYANMYRDENGVTLYETHLNKLVGFTNGRKPGIHTGGKISRKRLMDVLEGRTTLYMSNVRRKDLRELLAQEKMLPEQCACCGFSEERILDHKKPLLLSFRNNDRQDWNLDNLEMLCYNCYFIRIGSIVPVPAVDCLEGVGPGKKNEVNKFTELSTVDYMNLERKWANDFKQKDLSGEDLIVRK